MKWVFIIFYLFSLIIANVATAHFHPLIIFNFIIPIGTFFIGLTFLFRDFVQMKIGKSKTYFIVIFGLIVSAVSSFLLDDTLWIVFASAITFAISETLDTEIFSRIKKSFTSKVLISGFFSSLVDSIFFVIIGLSPIGANFVAWDSIFYLIVGQFAVKFMTQAFSIELINIFSKNKSEEAANG